MKSILETGIN